MVYDGFEWKFRGPRAQEVHIPDLAYGVDSVDIPCLKCDLCLVSERYSKALRIMCEAEMWPEKSYFLTLTFDPEHVGNGELAHDEWVQFMKDFRRVFCQAQYCDIRKRKDYYGKLRSQTFKTVKQVMCGEYGDTFGRKHFHGILFNHRFDDIRPVLASDGSPVVSKKGFPIHTSDSLRDVWKKGNVEVEEITFDLALYVAAYVTDRALDERPDLEREKKQYGRFGRGIGLAWISKYWRSVLAAGVVKLGSEQYPIPRYFHRKIKEFQPEFYARWHEQKMLKLSRKKKKIIEKGDGPLRRAKAKGRIFNSIQQKRRVDNGEKVQKRD